MIRNASTMVSADLKKKWWKFILHFVLTVCLVHCFILYDVTNHPRSTAHGNRQLTFRQNSSVSADWYIHVSQAYRQEEKFAHQNCIPTPFPYVTKNIRPCKSVCFVYQEKEKKLHQEGVKRQNINVSSVMFHCAVWGVFWNTTSSEMWTCKIR